VKDTVAHCPYMHALLVIVISAGARSSFLLLDGLIQLQFESENSRTRFC